MPSNKKLLEEFIRGIPDNAICPPRKDSGTLHSDENFRLDVQGVSHFKETSTFYAVLILSKLLG